MPKTYSYDPTGINKNGLDQMRFELGDTATETGEKTCILCDEEYSAILSGLEKGRSWKSLKIQCLKAIVMKLSYEVDYRVEEMSLALSERYKHFKEMLKELEKSAQIPVFTGKLGHENTADGGHYFTLGMQENPLAKG